MEITTALVLEKLILGITLAAPIGPVSVEMIKRGLRHGFLSAFSVRLGGALGNTLCLVATYYGLSHLLSYDWLLNGLGLLGAVLLIYMGFKTVMKGLKDLDLDAPVNVSNGLTWGFYLAIANPVAFVFWPGLFAATLDPVVGITLGGFVLNLFIVLGVLMWGLGLSSILAIGHQKLDKRIIVVLSKLAGIIMIYFGISYGIDVIGKLSV